MRRRTWPDGIELSPSAAREKPHDIIAMCRIRSCSPLRLTGRDDGTVSDRIQGAGRGGCFYTDSWTCRNIASPARRSIRSKRKALSNLLTALAGADGFTEIVRALILPANLVTPKIREHRTVENSGRRVTNMMFRATNAASGSNTRRTRTQRA
jgi:hypothetical protein